MGRNFETLLQAGTDDYVHGNSYSQFINMVTAIILSLMHVSLVI
jgi:hypothetical protein